MKIRIKKLNDRATVPTYGTDYSAGADLYAIDGVTVAPHSTVMVSTGLAIEIPEGYCGLVFARSGLASKRGLAPANKVGVVDAVKCHKLGIHAYRSKSGDGVYFIKERARFCKEEVHA